MDNLEYALQIREEIIQNPKILQALRNHLSGDELLSNHLGSGTNHCHYRVGRLDSGLWLATREVKSLQKFSSKQSLLENFELYCREVGDWMDYYKSRGIENIIKECDEEKEFDPMITSSLSLGVKYWSGYDWGYALVVEDLTSGGLIEYNMGVGEDEGVIKGTDYNVTFDLVRNPDDYRNLIYMVDKNLLILD